VYNKKLDGREVREILIDGKGGEGYIMVNDNW